MPRAIFLICLLVLGVGASTGCDDGGLVPVEGQVTLDGQPLPEAHVMFYPQDAGPTDQTFYFGSTDQNGKFTLRSGSDDPEGVPPGKYNVTLTTAVAKEGADETTPLPPERVPPKHRKQEFVVPETGAIEAKFEMTTK